MRISWGTRARATIVPSSSTASALTDDVPMSMPTLSGPVMRRSRRVAVVERARGRERGEDLVVQQTVRAHRAPTGRGPLSFQVREPTAGLLDDHQEGREIPEVHDRLDGGVRRSLGHEHVLEEVPDAARPPDVVEQIDH